jgi:hypothetical protein
MKWWRKRKEESGGERMSGQREADRAVNDAQKKLDQANAKWPEVRRVANSLAEHRSTNHFADAAQRALRRRGAT